MSSIRQTPELVLMQSSENGKPSRSRLMNSTPRLKDLMKEKKKSKI